MIVTERPRDHSNPSVAIGLIGLYYICDEAYNNNKCHCWDIAIFRFFQNGGRPPSWICYVHVPTTQGGYLVIFIAVQNLIGIDAMVLIICKCWHLTRLAEKCLFTIQMEVFCLDFTPEWEAVTSRPSLCENTYRSLRSVHPFLKSSLFYPVTSRNPMLCNALDTLLQVSIPVRASAPHITRGSLD